MQTNASACRLLVPGWPLCKRLLLWTRAPQIQVIASQPGLWNFCQCRRKPCRDSPSSWCVLIKSSLQQAVNSHNGSGGF